jgi:hypothetical protein
MNYSASLTLQRQISDAWDGVTLQCMKKLYPKTINEAQDFIMKNSITYKEGHY